MSAPRRYSPAFWNALASLTSHGVAAEQAGAAAELWTRLAKTEPSEPDILVTDEQAVQFVWFGDRYYLEVAVRPDGHFEWYFHDAEAPPGSSLGSDGPEVSLPAEFWACAQVAGVERAGR